MLFDFWLIVGKLFEKNSLFSRHPMNDIEKALVMLVRSANDSRFKLCNKKILENDSQGIGKSCIRSRNVALIENNLIGIDDAFGYF